MRLSGNAGHAGLTLVHDEQRHLVGLAEAVARVATHGPGDLPPGFADAVLRLALGRGLGVPVNDPPATGALRLLRPADSPARPKDRRRRDTTGGKPFG